MQRKVNVIRAHDFIRATEHGTIDFEHSVETLLEVVHAAARLEDFEILLDTRQAESNLTAHELWALVSVLGQHRDVFSRKTAVLCPEDRFQRVEFVVLCAQNRALNVQAFTSYEQAMEWLIAEAISDPGEPAEPTD
jgi:hypothetical protein